MKNKKYFLLVISFLLFVSLFYTSTNSISSVSDTATNKKNDYTSAQLVADLEQETSSTPQLSQTAAWDVNGIVICNEYTEAQKFPQICYDGNGGAIISWWDKRSGDYDIYAQKIDSAGNPQWKVNGTVISNAINTQSEAQICSDGFGGAIITWRDWRRGGNCDIYAQRIDSAGNTKWGESFWSGPGDRNGTVICNATETNPLEPQICSNGTDGAIITWADYRNSVNWDIYAQKIDSAGNTKWGDGTMWGTFKDRNGTVICNATNTQSEAQICYAGNGSAIITWEDYRITSPKTNIYAQKIDSAGNTHWGDSSTWGALPDRNGTVICNATGDQNFPQICYDGNGGAIITWEDDRVGGSISDIYAQKIDSSGNIHWGNGTMWGALLDRNGTVICNDTSKQWAPQICNITGGAIISWMDIREGSYDIYAQKIDSAGSPQWTANGTVICGNDNDEDFQQICSDGAGGAIITWVDYRGGGANIDIYAQKINSAGNIQWTVSGTVICNEDTANQYQPQICSDGAGGAIIVWADERSGTWDIYAQRMKSVSGRDLALPAGDDDDDDEDSGFVVVVVVIIILASVGGVVVVVIVLIKKGIIDVSKLRRG